MSADGAARAPGRVRLEPRRLQISYTVAWSARPDVNPIEVLCSIGFDRAGKAREIFVEQLLVGSDLDRAMRDAAICVSMLLQHGMAADELLAGLMRADVATAQARFADESTGASRPSLLAALVARAVRAELEDGDAVRAAYACAAGHPRLAAP